MDTNMFKYIAMFCAGIAVGSLGTKLIIDRLNEERLEEELPYSDPYAEEAESKDDHILEDPTVNVVDLRKKVKRQQKNYSALSKQEKGDLNALVEKYAPTPKVRVVSFDEFMDGAVAVKDAISYYDGDTTFCNQDEKVIDDPNTLFGANIQLHFGELNDDPDMVYVRNENLGIDYEINRIHNSYSVVILGMAPKTTRPRSRRKSRKESAENGNEKEIDEE